MSKKLFESFSNENCDINKLLNINQFYGIRFLTIKVLDNIKSKILSSKQNPNILPSFYFQYEEVSAQFR